MKRQLLFFILLTVLNFIAIAQNVTIPDANFKAYLIGNSSINTNGDAEIQVSEANAYTGNIFCQNQSISDLTGIEFFTQLNFLICNNNNLSSIDVSQNTALKSLNVENNNLTSLDLSQNTILTGLNCSDNNLTSLNLSQNTALQTLYCRNNNLNTLDVSQLTDVVSFNCSNNSIEILDFSQNTMINQNTTLEIPFINCQQNNLMVLKMQNISTTSLQGQYFNATSNPNLTCIEVDDLASATANWTNIDAAASYSTNCNPLTVGDTFIENFITYEITSLLPNEVKAHDYDHTNGPTDVNIPASVMNAGPTFSVTAIGFAAFEYDFIGNQLTSLVLPNTITQILPSAFSFNLIPDVIIPDGVTAIGGEAFSGNLITSVIIPDNVITIGYEAFVDNTISSLILGSSIEVIGEDAFAFNQIASVAFPNSLTTVGSRAFSGNQLTSVIIPSTITTLENSVFRDNLLTSVTIENGIATIPSDTFLNNQLQSVTIPDSVTSIDQSAFQNNQLTNVTFNDNILEIDSAAFRNNQLTSVTIPSSVTTMGTRVFLDNPLTSVTSAATIPPTIFNGGTIDTFATNRSGIDLTIPTGTTGAYVTDPGALWTGFNSVTEDASLSISDFELTNDISILNTKDELKIISNGLAVLKNYTIYSISGAKIKEGTNNTITIGAISNGIYILKLDFDKGTVVKKVVVN